MTDFLMLNDCDMRHVHRVIRNETCVRSVFLDGLVGGSVLDGLVLGSVLNG